jgi:FtsH-binding integral membrane protein
VSRLVYEIHLKTPARQTWFWVTVTLLLSAIVCHWVALSQNGQFLIIYTRALVENTLEQHEPIIDHHRRLMAFWYSIGLIQVLLAIGCWIFACRRAERGPSSVIILLLVGYAISFLILV